MKDLHPSPSESSGDVVVVRCAVVAANPDMPYILASEGPGKDQYTVNRALAGSLWGSFYRGQLLDIWLLRDDTAPSKLLSVELASSSPVPPRT